MFAVRIDGRFAGEVKEKCHGENERGLWIERMVCDCWYCEMGLQHERCQGFEVYHYG